ncbi:MAG: ABC transporter permease [Chloroflexi bacterium]|nr:ABC transporter permease [Chloroflexota bacterium]
MVTTWPRRVLAHRTGRPSLLVLAGLALVCLLAPVLVPAGPEAGSLASTLRRPSLDHLLGTDELGRDVLARMIWGGRISLSIALLVTALAPTFGALYGYVAAALPRPLGDPLMRLVDGLLAIPRLPLYLVLLTIVGPSYWAVVAVMTAFEWPAFARLAYLGALGCLHLPHVEAARALGASRLRIASRHVGPATAGPLLVAAAVGVRGRIVAEASLSYLGFGIAPPTPSWGNMLAAAQSRVWDVPALAIYPGLAILTVSVAATLLGDALRDANDPTTLRR